MGIIHAIQCQLIFLFASLWCFFGIIERRYIHDVVTFDNPLLECESMLLMVLVEVDTHFRQRLFWVFETEAGLDCIVAVAFLAEALNTALDGTLIHL